MFPILAFEVQIISQGISNWFIATLLARLIIAFEIFLGLSFFQNNYIKKIFIPAALALLSIFTLDLIWSIIINGTGGDCGCFGQLIKMTPVESIIKNLVLIAGLAYLYKLIDYEDGKKLLVPALFLIIPFAAVFLFFPLKLQHVDKYNENKLQKYTVVQKNIEKPLVEVPAKKIAKPKEEEAPKPKEEKEVAKPKEILPVYAYKNFSGGVTVDFSKGTEIVAVLNMECDECEATATAIGKLSREMKLPPVYYLLLGDQSEVQDFFNKTKTNYPYAILNEGQFFPLIQGSPPRIWLLQNGIITGDWNFKNFSVDNLKAAIKKLH
ncbi:MAG: hypothetical protein P4L45_16595 [Ignavibacteriaceae bacterium]|nr:hypothetical protein [Ignavibacteriaceae bacterium]